MSNSIIDYCLHARWTWVVAAYLVMSIVTFFFYCADKFAAKMGWWRIREKTLHLLEFLCGWPGALVAQRVVRHKSIKSTYQTVFKIMVALNVIAMGAVIYVFR